MDTSQPLIRKDSYDAGKARIKYSTEILCTFSYTFPKAYKPGGTMLGITTNLSGRIETDWMDVNARCRWTQFTGGNVKGKKKMMFSAYRVIKIYPSAAGYSTAFMQQYIVYMKDNVSKPKPKKQCLLDLASFLQGWKQKFEDNSIILMMHARGMGLMSIYIIF